MNHYKWSDAEKKVARGAFDKGLANELAALLKELKDRSSRADKPEDIWEINDYLNSRQRDIASTYDYRYSQLIRVFGTLLAEGWIEESDLSGLNEEKLQAIRRWSGL